MYASVSSLTRIARPSIVLILALAALLSGAMQPRVRAADPSAAPMGSMSPVVSEAPKTVCESAADLRLYVGFLQGLSIKEDGVVPVLVGTAASIAEASTLAVLVQETYRPLVDELIDSLRDLGSVARGFADEATIGAGLVQIGEGIARVGTAMDALSAAISEPCPSAVPDGSALPAMSAPPAASTAPAG